MNKVVAVGHGIVSRYSFLDVHWEPFTRDTIGVGGASFKSDQRRCHLLFCWVTRYGILAVRYLTSITHSGSTCIARNSILGEYTMKYITDRWMVTGPSMYSFIMIYVLLDLSVRFSSLPKVP